MKFIESFIDHRYRFTTNTSGLMVGLGMHTTKPKVDPQVLKEISQVITHYMYDNRTYVSYKPTFRNADLFK